MQQRKDLTAWRDPIKGIAILWVCFFHARLGLSVDKDKAAWEKMAASGQLAGVQLLLGSGSRFQSDYNIEGIPHFILLDKEGKVVNADMLRPSSEDTERILNELEGI